MAVRPFVKTGIALAGAGLLIATAPAIAPPLTQRELQVAADLQASLSDIIDAFIEGGSLQAAIVALAGPDNDIANAFIEGGSLQALLFALGGGNPVVDAFIEGGSLQSAIVAAAGCSNPDCGPSDPPVPGEVVNPVANGFINGGTLQAALTPFAGNPVVQGFIDGGALQAALTPFADNPVVQGFIDGGALQAALTPFADNPAVQAFIDGGALQSAIVAAAGCSNPDCGPSDPEDPTDVVNPVANGFINGGTLQAGLVAVRDATAATTLGTTSQQGTQTLARTGGAPQPNGSGLVDNTAGLNGTQKLVDDIQSNSLVFSGGPKAASDPAPVITLPDKKPTARVADDGEEDGGLVRNSLSFKPEVIIPFGKKSDDAGGPTFTDIVKGFMGGGESEGTSGGPGGGFGNDE